MHFFGSLLLLRKEQLLQIKEARNKVRCPQSLSCLAMKTVLKNYSHFTDIPDSPLKYLRELKNNKY
jgi:hypothetical protein